MIDYEINLVKKKNKMNKEASDSEDEQHINSDFKIFNKKSYLCQENSFVNSPETNKRKKKLKLKTSGFSLECKDRRDKRNKIDKKDKGDLEAAGLILYDVISRVKSQEIGSLENHESAHRNKGYIHCKYGNSSIVLYNIH